MPDKLSIQETDVLTEKIEHVDNALATRDPADPSYNKLLASLGSYVHAHARKVIASLDLAAYGTDPDETSDVNLIKALALLALTDPKVIEGFVDQGIEEPRLDTFLMELVSDLEDFPAIRAIFSRLEGYYEYPFEDEETDTDGDQHV